MLPRKISSNIQKDTMLSENDHRNQYTDDQIKSLSASLEKLNTSKLITPMENKFKIFQDEALEVEKRKKTSCSYILMDLTQSQQFQNNLFLVFN